MSGQITFGFFFTGFFFFFFFLIPLLLLQVNFYSITAFAGLFYSITAFAGLFYSITAFAGLYILFLNWLYRIYTFNEVKMIEFVVLAIPARGKELRRSPIQKLTAINAA